MTMRAVRRALRLIPLAVLLGVATASADLPTGEGVTVSINTLGIVTDYPVLTRGQVVIVNAQRFVVTQEPRPLATLEEAPPEAQAIEVEQKRPPAPTKSAIWVAGHWIYGPSGYSWVAGRYVAARPGHVFVPPRWAVHEEQHLYFGGFYVPRNVYVRSHFNRYYYTGAPKHGSQTTHGPYWPVGAPTRANSAFTSANARDPYWPIGARR
ncbi:MAG: hypothetical protein WBM48_18480 [Polyangiales bacterium]|jgi:hypothetical protein